MKPLLNLELVNTFLSVVENNGFNPAANHLFRSQAAVSMQIKRLETQLGHRLMERNSQGVTLTEQGKTLLGYAERLIRLNYETIAALSDQPLLGKINFGVPTDYGQTFLEKFLPVLQADFPSLSLNITCSHSRNLRPLIKAGSLDVAIVTAEAAYPNESGLWSEPLSWCRPFGTSIDNPEPLRAAILNSDCTIRDLAIRDLKATQREYETAMLSPDLSTIAASVESGLAIALLPQSSITSTKIEPFDLVESEGRRLLSMNLIDSGAVKSGVVDAIRECCLKIAGNTWG